MREVRWERMFPDELERAFAECPLVYFAYGLCEPHGPQNAIGLDALKAHAIACEAARAFGGIVAPPDFWHVHELGGYAIWGREWIGDVPRKWLTALPPWQHFKNVCYQVRAADAIGFHAAILITGHYGPNWEDLRLLTQLIQPSVGCRLYDLPDYEANKPGFANDNRSGGDHAGKVETSLLWATMPECVDVSRIPPDPAAHPWAMGLNAHESNRRTGERMVADEVRWLVAKAKELLADYDRERPTVRLSTFEQVEQLWDSVVRPHVKDFKSMAGRWGQQNPVPEDSTWYANAVVPKRD
ncbi:MAG TPA: creatininase family protein [Planctomycetota bacterium]|nr:creatininase family protein [Planctomycetota bacterium]